MWIYPPPSPQKNTSRKIPLSLYAATIAKVKRDRTI